MKKILPGIFAILFSTAGQAQWVAQNSNYDVPHS
jgi:uncharacterized protein YxeA